MASSTEKGTRTGTVYSQLRRELLRGDLPPGSKIHIGETAARHAVSPSVVREAATRLVEQGLVVAMPQRGFAVPELSVEDLCDLTRARTLIETAALRESIADGDLAWESKVLAAHHRLRHTQTTLPDGHIHPDWAEAHRDFHHVLLTGGKSGRLIDIADSLRDCSVLYIHWSRELAHDDNRDVAEEHRKIAELAIARDADLAAAALATHIERTTEALVRYTSQLRDTSNDIPA